MKPKTFSEIWEEERKNPTPPTPEQIKFAKGVIAQWNAIAKATKDIFKLPKK